MLRTILTVESAVPEMVQVEMTSIAEFDISDVSEIEQAMDAQFVPIIRDKMQDALENITKAMNVTPISFRGQRNV